MIRIDGSLGEGGGQVLRNSIAYACILRKAMKIENIRAGRSKPGLQAQHLTGLRLAAEICGGTLKGDNLRSETVTYTPSLWTTTGHVVTEGERDEATFVGDIGTAGSICLLLQTALPCALFGHAATPCRLILKGGTNASLAPQYDYWEHVFWPMVQTKLCLPPDLIQSTVVRRGYFPRGGGEVHMRIQPWNTTIPPIVLTDLGEVCDIYIRSHVAGNLPRHVATVMAKAAQTTLQQSLTGTHVSPRVEIVMESNAVGSGSGILIVATTTTGCRLGGSAIGRPKKRAQEVGMEAAQELVSAFENGGCVDDWLQDQLIIFMALANGTSEMLTGCLTLHTQTAISVAEQMCGAKFQVTKLSDGNNIHKEEPSYGKDGRVPGTHLIRCDGIAFFNKT